MKDMKRWYILLGVLIALWCVVDGVERSIESVRSHFRPSSDDVCWTVIPDEWIQLTVTGDPNYYAIMIGYRKDGYVVWKRGSARQGELTITEGEPQ